MKAMRLIVAAACLASGLAVPAFADDDKDKTVVAQVNTDRGPIWVQMKAKDWDREHRTWVQRGGYVGYRVPDDKFTMYFGPEKTFRINTLPYRDMSGRPYFQYNGYWMTIVDPWPQTWPEGWYDTDDLYVRWDNGYYLYNRKYPDVGLSLEIRQ